VLYGPELNNQTESPVPTVDAEVTLRRTFPAVALAVCLSLLNVSMIAPILPPYVSGMGASGLWLGIVLAVYSLVRAVLMPVFGWLSDQRGRKAFLLIGLSMSIPVSLAYIPATTIPLLIAVRIVHGVATAMIVPVATAYIGELTAKGHEGKWMGRLNTATMIGMGAGPLAGGILAQHMGIDAVFFVMAGLYLVAVLGISLSVKDSRPNRAASGSHPSFRKISRSPRVLGLFAYWMTFEISITAIMTFIPLFALGNVLIDFTGIGLLFAVNILTTSLLQIWTGKTADRHDRLKLAIYGGIITCAPLAFIPVSTAFWHLLAIMIVSGVGIAVFMPALSAIQVEEGRMFGMASTGASIHVSMAIGVAIGPVAAGVVNDLSGLAAVFYFSAAIGIPGIATFVWFNRRRPQRQP
jgi:DHA1 family multidrug resistance protein-like MFS transporter